MIKKEEMPLLDTVLDQLEQGKKKITLYAFSNHSYEDAVRIVSRVDGHIFFIRRKKYPESRQILCSITSSELLKSKHGHRIVFWEMTDGEIEEAGKRFGGLPLA